MFEYFIMFIALYFLYWCWCEYKEKQEKYESDTDPVLYKLKNMVRTIHPEIDNLQIYKGKKSYIIDKKKIYMCLKDQHGQYYNTNYLVYVLLHEFSHYLNKNEVGHTENFHKIFDELLDRATESGIYDKNIPMIEDYCNF
jgi:hypothetical protein